MGQSSDDNAAIWKSEEGVASWTSNTDERERTRAQQWRFIGELLPFDDQDTFTFLDLGAGTGTAARAVLQMYPRSTAILADFSPQMMGQGEREMQPFAGRFQYVEFDMSTNNWPAAIPVALDAVVTSMCIHHLPDYRKQGLFAEIFQHLAPGAWYLNYDPVTTTDPIVQATWQRVNDLEDGDHGDDPAGPSKHLHRTPAEQSRYENHVRHIIPLAQQLGYLQSAGFQGIDVYWKHLENVIYGGCRPA